MEVAPSVPLWLGAVAALGAHTPPQWESLGAGGRMVLYGLAWVTLNPSLHISVSLPLPRSVGPVSGRPVHGRVCEGGRVLVCRGKSRTSLDFSDGFHTGFGRNAGLHLPATPKEAALLAHATQASFPPPGRSKALGSLTYPSSFLCTITSPEIVWHL